MFEVIYIIGVLGSVFLEMALGGKFIKGLFTGLLWPVWFFIILILRIAR